MLRSCLKSTCPGSALWVGGRRIGPHEPFKEAHSHNSGTSRQEPDVEAVIISMGLGIHDSVVVSGL